MKNIVRAFVLSLVVTGAYASTQIHASTATTMGAAKNSAIPMPPCPPGDPNGCGICDLGGCGK